MAMEIIDILRSENAHSHTEHLYMDVLIALIGISLVSFLLTRQGVIELLILFRVIWSPFLPFVCGVLWTFVGLFFTVHAQVTSFFWNRANLTGQLTRPLDAPIEHWNCGCNGFDVVWRTRCRVSIYQSRRQSGIPKHWPFVLEGKQKRVT